MSITATVMSLPVTSLSMTRLFHAAWIPARAVSEYIDPRSRSAAQAPESSTALDASLALTSPQSVPPTASPLGTTGFGAGFGAGAGLGVAAVAASAAIPAPIPRVMLASTATDARRFHPVPRPACGGPPTSLISPR